MVAGSLNNPETVVIELIDFFLMDIGSASFTSFNYGADITEYLEQNPHLMEDGIRTGCLHSHHTMSTFFSSEDVDDLVVNTRDRDVDYYLSVIINTHGNWISRIAFRTEETITEYVERKFYTTMRDFAGWKAKSNRKYKKSVLCMLPLEVTQEGFVPEERIEYLYKRKKEKADAEAAERAKNYTSSYDGYDYPPGGNGKAPSNLIHIPAGRGSEGFINPNLSIELQRDILMGELMTASMTFRGGLDAAVNMFRKKTSDANGTIFQTAIILHADMVCSNAENIINMFEGTIVSNAYVVANLNDLWDILIEDYSSDGNGTQAVVDEDPIDAFISALEMNIDKLEIDDEQSSNLRKQYEHDTQKTKPRRKRRGPGPQPASPTVD